MNRGQFALKYIEKVVNENDSLPVVSKSFICSADTGNGNSVAAYAVYTKNGKLHWHTFKKWKMKLWILWHTTFKYR